MAHNPKPIRRELKRFRRLMRDIYLAGKRACRHVVIEDKVWPDGSIDGRCGLCGDDSFVIRDATYEEWVAAEGINCGFGAREHE